MLPFAILWPTFALVALVFVVWLTLFVQRFGHMRRNPPTAASFATSASAATYFEPVEMAANNLGNLFEMPVLYFALVPLLLVTAHANVVQVALAWAFVVCRAIHSFVHIGPKKVQPRFMVYLLSCALLSAMWIGFFVDMVSAATAYHAAMTSMSAQP